MSISKFSINGLGINSSSYKKNSEPAEVLAGSETQADNENASSPVEYILAGFAGCLNVVINIEAKDLNLKIYDMKININGNIDNSKVLDLNNEDHVEFESIDVNIDFVTNATQESIDFLLNKVKQRYPINDNLNKDVPILYHINITSYSKEVYA